LIPSVTRREALSEPLPAYTVTAPPPPILLATTSRHDERAVMKAKITDLMPTGAVLAIAVALIAPATVPAMPTASGSLALDQAHVAGGKAVEHQPVSAGEHGGWGWPDAALWGGVMVGIVLFGFWGDVVIGAAVFALAACVEATIRLVRRRSQAAKSPQRRADTVQPTAIRRV
jgi:hypothetical protein